MSNFKIYLEKVQGNHEAKIETSNFLNENFRNYMEKVFYMELTGTPEKTSLKNTNFSNPNIEVKDEKETDEEIQKNNEIKRSNSDILLNKYIDIIIYPKSQKIGVSLKDETELKKSVGQYALTSTNSNLTLDLLKGAKNFILEGKSFANSLDDFKKAAETTSITAVGPTANENSVKVTISNTIIKNILEKYFSAIKSTFGAVIIKTVPEEIIISNKTVELQITDVKTSSDGTKNDMNEKSKVNALELIVKAVNK